MYTRKVRLSPTISRLISIRAKRDHKGGKIQSQNIGAFLGLKFELETTGYTRRDPNHFIYMTHPHPLLAAGVPATPQKSLAVTSNN